MQQINLHRQKLIALAIAAVALIFMFLPWYSPTDAMEGALKIARALGTDPTANPDSRNGFHGWGFLSLGGIIGIVILSLMGDKTRPYEGQIKQGAMVAFADIAIGALISLFDLGKDFNSGAGLYLCIATGLIGLAWVGQFLKNMNFSTTATSPTVPTPPPTPGAIPAPPGSMPPPPPPPPSA